MKMMGLHTGFKPVFESMFFECLGLDVEAMDYTITGAGACTYFGANYVVGLECMVRRFS